MIFTQTTIAAEQASIAAGPRCRRRAYIAQIRRRKIGHSLTTADVEFPEPWIDGGNVGGYHIEPIKTAPDLSRYAYRLHNCATSYAHQVAQGCRFFYVVLNNDKPKAMVELVCNGEHGELSQLKGPCNGQVSEELTTAVNTWFDAA